MSSQHLFQVQFRNTNVRGSPFEQGCGLLVIDIKFFQMNIHVTRVLYETLFERVALIPTAGDHGVSSEVVQGKHEKKQTILGVHAPSTQSRANRNSSRFQCSTISLLKEIRIDSSLDKNKVLITLCRVARA